MIDATNDNVAKIEASNDNRDQRIHDLEQEFAAYRRAHP
jgi:hypothetical protein